MELFDEKELVSGDLEMLPRIDPSGLAEDEGGDLDLERAWAIAAADIVSAHNARTDLRSQEERIGPRPQRWALDVLGDPSVALPSGAEPLSVEPSSTVPRALGEIEERVLSGGIGGDEAAVRIVEVVEGFSLRLVEPPPLPQRITADDLGVMCWMGVLPPA